MNGEFQLIGVVLPEMQSLTNTFIFNYISEDEERNKKKYF